MRIVRRLAGFIVVFCFSCCLTLAQEAAASTQALSITDYIHQAWDTLSRSMTDCHSLADPKLNGAPGLLYLPADLTAPPEVDALKSQCNVRVEHLPRPIHKLGDVRVSEIPTPGLLYLPNRYVVPGGRFNEMYGWDSYFIILGLVRDGRIDLARGMVDNFFFEIEHYGAILNANRTYYLTRSQPPFLTSMIRAVYEAEVAADPGERKTYDTWLARGFGYAERDHAFWETQIHRAGNTGLARYFDIGEGPVPEMEDDSTYYADVIRWLLAHPEVKTDYMVKGPDEPNAEEQARLTRESCDPKLSTVCARAHFQGYRLSRDFYVGDRAMRESGFDPSNRFGPFSGSTHHYAPVCLNSLLYKYEMDLAWMAGQLGKAGATWRHRAALRRAAMDKYLWNSDKGMYFDYDFMANRHSTYVYISTLYPLWAGAANTTQTAGLGKGLALLEQPGGIAMSTTNTGLQWDLPFGWAPTSWVSIHGLDIAGFHEDAQRVSRKFSHTIEENYERDKTIREKYNVVNSSSDVQVATGYKMNVVGFGWTNAVYLEMQHLLASGGTQAKEKNQ
jgi:alpha,alpha-trehalase